MQARGFAIVVDPLRGCLAGLAGQASSQRRACNCKSGGPASRRSGPWFFIGFAVVCASGCYSCCVLVWRLAMVPAPFFNVVSRVHRLLFVMACHGFVYYFGLVCNGLACFFIVLPMVPAWFTWVGPWVGFLFPVLVYVVGLSGFLLSRAPCLSLVLLLFACSCYSFCLLYHRVGYGAGSISHCTVSFSVFAICLGPSWFCLLIWLGFHCFGLCFHCFGDSRTIQHLHVIVG